MNAATLHAGPRARLARIACGVGAASLLFAATPAGAAEAKLDPKADATIVQMSTALAAAKSFSVHVTDAVTKRLADGTMSSRTLSRKVLVRRPNAVRMEIRGEKIDALLVYDAGNLILKSNPEHVYAQTNVPPTIDEAMDFLAVRLRIPMPLGDMLSKSPHDSLISADTSGKIVGDETVGGVACRHLAFQDPVVDWEIWVREGKTPLPVRLLIHYKLADGGPKADVSFSDWNLSAEVPASAFAITMPDDFRRIRVAVPRPDAPDESPVQ